MRSRSDNAVGLDFRLLLLWTLLAGMAWSQSAVRGRGIFQRNCLACHGAEATGGRGPALNSGVFPHGASDAEIYQHVRYGIPGTPMPGFEFGDPEIRDVIAYLRSLVKNHSSDSGALAASIDAKAAERGRQVYQTSGCPVCHAINGEGGIVGPDLSAIGLYGAEYLNQRIVHPGTDNPWLQPETIDIETRDGRHVRGRRLNEDTQTLQLRGLDGSLYLLKKKDLTSIRYERSSLMPGDYGQRLSTSQLQDLVTFLKTLRGSDPQRLAKVSLPAALTFERLRDAGHEPQNWLTYWGNYQGWHYSASRQIAPSNVGRLQAQWALQLPGGNLETTPLVIDGVMYITGPPDSVYALDAHSGKVLWQYQGITQAGAVNRGVAVLGGRVFFLTYDGTLLALDARTGRLLWKTKVADRADGYFETLAPLALRDRIIVGASGGEFGATGFIAAYDGASGKRLWKFDSVPGPGQPGHETWAGDGWKHGGGPTWLTGTYDPESNLIYWGVGNPSPDMDGAARPGDNLFTCSVVAIDADSGRLRWHFQFSPHDTHDWDSNQDMILIDRDIGGRQRKLLLHADRNGFFYVLDRVTGQFLHGAPFVKVSWAKGLDAQGRPILVPGNDAAPNGPVIAPGSTGATNWQSPSYSPRTGWVYLAFHEGSDHYFLEPQSREAGRAWWGGHYVPVGGKDSAGVLAIDPSTGDRKWATRLYSSSLSAGVLATGGGLVFAASSDGNLLALDDRTGKILWSFQTGAPITTAPISYALQGRQYICVMAGSVLYSFALPASASRVTSP